MVGSRTLQLQSKTKDSLISLLLKDYNSGIESANLQEICRVVPLLGDLDLASEAVGLYLKFVKDVLGGALGEATGGKEDPPSLKVAKVFNAAGTVLRHHLPMVSQALGAAEGDRGLLQLVHLEVERKVLSLISEMRTDLEDLKTVATFVPKLEDDLTCWGRGELGDEALEQTLNVEEVDRGCEDCASLIQYIESYDSFLKHCCSEVVRASELRGKEGSSSPIIPAITELGEAAIELGAILSGGEQALLLASIVHILASPTKFEKFEEGSRAMCSNLVEEIFYAAQRSALRAVAR